MRGEGGNHSVKKYLILDVLLRFDAVSPHQELISSVVVENYL